ncbi:MAG TPA: 3-oxoacyl-ACP reductase family protein [Xanthobacteraceae bacterium]|nr:3-oxoacyl-ACP reductase family protein [Xanthobacteraceae bacterium]
MSSLQTNDLRTVVEPSLRGLVAIVTGAGQGLGRVFAKAFALAGATAVIAERNHDKGRAVAAEIGNAAFAIHTDVADPASIDGMVAEVDRRFGRVDILVNNAGIFSTLEMRPFEQIPLDEWEQVLRVNVTGPFLCARAVLPAMRRAKWGRIINMASGAVTLGRPNYLHYITSKAALVGMTRSMARELGADGITVNSILPGATFTEIERKTVSPEQKQRIVAQQCIPRPEVPEDLVGTVLFLASEASAFVTGQALTVDGGCTHP